MNSVSTSLICFAPSVISANWTALYCSNSHPITNQPFNIKPEHQLYYAKQQDETSNLEAATEPSLISRELGGIRYDNLS